MDTSFLNTKFERIGARLKILHRPNRRATTQGMLSLDIGTDRIGEYFEIASPVGIDPVVEVIDLQPAHRHLLLLVREEKAKSKYLCGHDERHWFVAGIPEKAAVGTVRQAMEALQPKDVQLAVAQSGLSSRVRNRRKNVAFVRQGEWFFLPVESLVVDEKLVLQNEPLRRGNGGKPHWVDYCYRTGGEAVYVCNHYPNGLTDDQYRQLLARKKNAHTWGWRPMRRNPGVFVRGRVRHSDHATITLHGWHRVLMNTENESIAMRHVAFLD